MKIQINTYYTNKQKMPRSFKIIQNRDIMVVKFLICGIIIGSIIIMGISLFLLV